MQTDIAIIGGGLSGLSLAQQLQQTGRDWMLVEARERFGGRILSQHFSDHIAGTGCESLAADLGPSWVWPGQPRIAALLRSLSLDTFEQYSAGRLVYEDETGQVRRDLDYSTMAGSLRIDGGIAKLIGKLVDTLPAQNLRLGHPVTALRRGDNGFEIDVQHGNGLCLQAQKVVLALPPRIAVQRLDLSTLLTDQQVAELQAIPTWMAGHAKVFARYTKPFWRELGLSGDAISRRGPLMEIHDASNRDGSQGGLFGFVGLPATSPARETAHLQAESLAQLTRLFGNDAANPVEILIKDWYQEAFTAVPEDASTTHHPQYRMPAEIERLAGHGLVFASSEMAPVFGGFIEGALEAAEQALARI